MSTILVSYATEEYRKAQLDKHHFSEKEGFDNHSIYTKTILENLGFWKEYQNILDPELNGGVKNGGCLWKPYLILKEMDLAQEGDIIFYSDCGDELLSGIKNFVVSKVNEFGYMLIQNIHSNINYTSMTCFRLMNCYKSEYMYKPQLEAGNVAFKVNEKNKRFVREWLKYCKNKDIILAEKNENEQGNLIRHSRDQSILTNLQIKYDMSVVSIYEAMRYIKYNAFG